MLILTFVTANLLVLLGAASLARLFRLGGLLDRLLAVFTLALAQIIVSLLIAGVAFRQLQPGLVLLINLIGALGAWLWARRANSGAVRLPLREFGDLLREMRSQPWAIGLALLASGAAAWTVFLGYLLPPHAYDGLYYHLVTVAQWLQAGRIDDIPFPIWSDVYPANTELVFAWLVIFLRADTWVDLGQLLFAGGGVLACMGLARLHGASRSGAVAAGCLFFLTPVVLTQAGANYTDVAQASSFLVCLYFINRYLRQPGLGYAALAGVAAGITLGTKFGALSHVGVAGALLLAHSALASWRGRASFRQAVGPVLAFGLLALLLGAYWYVNNWIDHGNPVYPYRVSVFGRTVFAGVTAVHDYVAWVTPETLTGKPWWQQVWLSWLSEPGPYRYDQRLGGFGPQWPILQLPAVALFSGYSLFRRRAAFLTVILPVGILFLTQPANWWSRYTIVIAALGALSLVFIIEAFQRRWPRYVLQAGSLSLALMSTYFIFYYYSLSPDTSLIGPELAARTLRLAPAERTLGRVFRPEFRWVDRIDSGSRIAVDPEEINLIYPLYGPRLQHEVAALPAPGPADLISWMRQERIDYLFTQAGSGLDGRAVRDAAHFQLIDAAGGYRVYRVRPARAAFREAFHARLRSADD